MFSFLTAKYYICSIAHMSCDLVFPSDEDIYWVGLNSNFIDDMKKDNMIVLNGWSPIRGLGKEKKNNDEQKSTEKLDEDKDNINKKNEGLRRDGDEDADDNETEKSESVRSSKARGKSVVKLDDVPRRTFKRKLRNAERDIAEYKRAKRGYNTTSMKEQILLLEVDVGTKALLMDKYDSSGRMSGSDYNKTMSWLTTALSIPFGKYRSGYEAQNGGVALKERFKEIKSILDETVYGMEDVKQEILEFVARKISNPNGKGHVLALCGEAGVGKTKVCKALAKALSLPFYQISCGGLNDGAVLVGHSETYVGSKPGRIAEILQSAGCMNPIVYLDEVDKIGSHKGREINGILTHLLDEEQNDKFYDNYLSNVPIDVSKVLFVISFNDVSKVDAIVSDRMKIIYINTPTLNDKVNICCDKMIPEILEMIKIDDRYKIQITKEVVEYMAANYSDVEGGVRKLKKSVEKVLSKVNYDIMMEAFDKLKLKDDTINVTVSYIRDALGDNGKQRDSAYLSMYT